MIQVDKEKYEDGTDVSEPVSLSRTDRSGKTETEKAIAYYSATPKPTKGFSFEKYKSDDVKKILEKLFHHKCAYCESKYAHTMPMDVEHFRPKSIYYWLAADWDNLLPSCIDCNRERYQTTQNGTIIKTGKQDHFPLLGKTPPLNDTDHSNFNLTEEENYRQLLQPCIDNPEEYLKYESNGYVFPESPDDLNRGEKSIEVYGLYRMELVKARREHLIKIFACIGRVQNIISVIDKLIDVYVDNNQLKSNIEEIIKQLEKNLNKDLKELKGYIKGDKPYTGMARQFINAFLDRIGIS